MKKMDVIPKLKKGEEGVAGIHPSVILLTYRTLKARLMEYTEDELWVLMKFERANENRPSFLVTIYGRLSVLRRSRELKEYLPEGTHVRL